MEFAAPDGNCVSLDFVDKPMDIINEDDSFSAIWKDIIKLPFNSSEKYSLHPGTSYDTP